MYVQEEASEYGIDWSGPSSAGNVVERVTVPQIPDFLTTDQLSFLKSLVNPLKQCDDYGKSFYVDTRQLVREMLLR